MLHLIPPNRVDLFPRGDGIQSVAVRSSDNGRIVGGLGPPLNLQTGQPDLRQIPEMVNHAHIPGVENVGTLLVLFNGEILPGRFSSIRAY